MASSVSLAVGSTYRNETPLLAYSFSTAARVGISLPLNGQVGLVNAMASAFRPEASDLSALERPSMSVTLRFGTRHPAFDSPFASGRACSVSGSTAMPVKARARRVPVIRSMGRSSGEVIRRNWVLRAKSHGGPGKLRIPEVPARFFQPRVFCDGNQRLAA